MNIFDRIEDKKDIRKLPTYKSKYTGFDDCIPGHGGCAMVYVLSDKTDNELKVYSSEDLNKAVKFHDWEVCENPIPKGDGMYGVCWECLDDYCQGDSADIFMGTAEEVEDFIIESFKDMGIDSNLSCGLPTLKSKDISICTYKYR